MRKLWRAVPALFVAATLLVPVAPASAAWSCSYYRWNAASQEWERVVLLQPAEEFERTHTWGVDWHCKYNCVPAITWNPDDPFDNLDPQNLAEEVIVTAQQLELAVPSPSSLSTADPWNGMPCPPVPPVWDADELDPVLGGVIG